MSRPIVTAAEKKANATHYCTSPRHSSNAALKASRDSDFAFLVKIHMKNVRQGRTKAIANATAIINAREHLYTNAGPPQEPCWSYSPTSPRPFAHDFPLR